MAFSGGGGFLIILVLQTLKGSMTHKRLMVYGLSCKTYWQKIIFVHRLTKLTLDLDLTYYI